MHIYAFGSICRGDVDLDSDIDLLAIVDSFDDRFDPATFSIYSYKRVKEIWSRGNPFAWHLSIESKLLYSSDLKDFIGNLGEPQAYKNIYNDCSKFYLLYCDSLESIKFKSASPVFELSTMFLAIRNFATCYALGIYGMHEYSRFSATRLREKSVPIKEETLSILARARILSTRGRGNPISKDDLKQVISRSGIIKEWMNKLLMEVTNERVQQ